MEALTQLPQLAYTNRWALLLISSSSTLAQMSQKKTTKNKQTGCCCVGPSVNGAMEMNESFSLNVQSDFIYKKGRQTV